MRTPTTCAERWSEVVNLSHEGLAVLDADARFEIVSERTAAGLDATRDQLRGRPLVDVLPELSSDELDAIRAAPAADGPVRLLCTRRGSDGWIRALRLTFVPRARPHGRPVGTIMLSHDITALRVVQDQQRRAQHRLTAVEDEEQLRIRREVHDGPVQVLAALALWIGVTARRGSDSVEMTALEEAIDQASTELREILDVPTPTIESPAQWLQRWAAPLIHGAPVTLEIDDRCTEPPNRATTEALFVFLYESIKATFASRDPGTIIAILSGEPAGYRLALTVPGGLVLRTDPATDETAATSLDRYATLLGGSIEWYDDERGAGRLTAVLPPLDDRGWSPDSRPPASVRNEPGPATDAFGDDPYAALTDADREAVIRASYQGLMELDADLKIVKINDSSARITQQPAAALVGRRLDELFHPDDYSCLQPHIERARTGRPIRFEWRRRNGGGPCWAQVAVSPRVGASGRVEGALVTTLDTTDLHVAEELRDAVLADLTLARRAARRRTAGRLHAGPIERLEAVNERLLDLIGRAHESERSLPAIQRELERSIVALRAMAERLDEPDRPAERWDRAGPAVPT